MATRPTDFQAARAGELTEVLRSALYTRQALPEGSAVAYHGARFKAPSGEIAEVVYTSGNSVNVRILASDGTVLAESDDATPEWLAEKLPD